MRKILLFPSLFLICISAIGQTQLDSSFGNNGIVRSFFPLNENISFNYCEQVIAQPDGSFFLLINVNQQVLLHHRFANGAIDLNYGENGYSVPFSMSGGRAALLPNGKMIIGGGTSSNDDADFVIVCYNADGRLDKTFADNGKRIIDFSGRDFLNDITIQSDGKILAVGYYNIGAGFAIARLNNDGSFDNSFSDDGKQTTFFGNFPGISSSPNSVAVGSDGRIIAAGRSVGGTAVVAYLPNGDLDSSFGENGVAKFDFSENEEVKTVAIQTDGKIVLAGNAVIEDVFHAAVFRLNADGTLDTGFSGDGKLFMDLVYGETAQDMAIDPEGNILIAGVTRIEQQVAMVASFTSSGLPDNSFSGDGIATMSVGEYGVGVYSLAIQPNAKILVAGSYPRMAGSDYYALCFNTNGSPDHTFDNDGMVSGYVNTGFTEFHASAIQPDGKIICAGTARTMAYASDFVVARFNVNGSLDQTFSQDGFATVRFEPGPFRTAFFYGSAHAVAIQPDGKIIVVGESFNDPPDYNGVTKLPTYNYAVARLNSDGSMDSSFSGDGKLITDLFGADDYAYAVAIQPDGKIVVAGASAYAELPANLDFSLVRYNSDGTLDNSFSWDGKHTTEFFSGVDKVSKVIIQPDGKILAAGSGGTPYGPWTTGKDFALARYLPNGYPDNSFGYDGAIKIDFQSFDDAASDAVLFPDGSILVGGTAGEMQYGNGHFAVAKLRPNGFLDSSFATNGKKIVPLGFALETCNAMAVQSNGGIVLGGSVSNSPYPISQDIGMIRLFSDGTPDNSLSFGGNHFIDLGSTEETIESINIQNNRIYAIGHSWYGGKVGFIMAFKLDCSFGLTIPDAFAMHFGVDPNTVYSGYAPADDLTLTAKTNGKPPFTYAWNTGAITKSIHVSPNTPTTYSVTVTDASGCVQQASKAVNVVNVRCGHKGEKVLICQVQPGKWKKRKTVCVDPWAATALLWKGARLGNCPTEELPGATISQGIEEENSFGMVASPNPSYDQFALDIKLKDLTPAELIIRDIQGRIIERMTIHSTSLIRIGSNFSSGIYMAELRQGENRLVIKLVRASR